MPTTRALLAAAADQLRSAGVPSPEVDAELLLAHVTGRPRAMLRLGGTEIDGAQAQRLAELVAARVRRIPLQHLTGTAPFRHVELRVGPGVFIPRPETELLVDAALAHLGGRPSPGVVIVDLCSGSGALALSLALEAPGSRVIAVELSAEALPWIGANIADHATALASVGSSMDVVSADATTVAQTGGPLADLRGRAAVVVTNPPYVPDGAVPREPEVRDHDPHVALFGGPDGLDVVRPLAVQAALLLRSGGLLLVEHADLQGEAAGEHGVPAVLRAQPAPSSTGASGSGSEPSSHGPASPAAAAWIDVVDHLDLAGRPRYTSAIRAGQG